MGGWGRRRRWRGLEAVIAAVALWGLTDCAKRKPVEAEAAVPAPRADYILPATPPDEAGLAQARAAADQAPDRADLQWRAGLLYQRLSPPDRWDYLDRAARYLERAVALDSRNPAFLMFLGLAKAGMAKNPKANLFEKLSLARNGFRRMDQAIELAGDNFSLRLLRAKAQLLAPPILGRGKLLAEDRAFVLSSLAAQPKFVQAAAWLFLGDWEDRAAGNRERARELWAKARELGAGAVYGEQAAGRLEGRPSGF